MRLKDLRQDKDLFQKDIAKLLGIKQQQYSRYELNIQNMPLEMLTKLSLFYNTSIDYILGITDEKKPYARNKSISYNNYYVN